ncbi:GNAT family N-acetyltransferase [Virgibacillus halodenitrificans]|uniref:GNAT family N-acetyltransferase n=1 Tax=Virgibacillus halodenitrificans TaxID=1482 RepID=A0ABR7VJH4_VIRHA|nr:GNAT family N-acetyltransferase [Virgibacillus halodenitrificans]MBD1221828.1 GNAT family N-acetyltransferase [Virgibacillus halodenitrificans]
MTTALYHKIADKLKFVEGANFVTIEDTKNVSKDELVYFIQHLDLLPNIRNAANVNILVDGEFSEAVEDYLNKQGFQLYDEIVTVYKDLKDLPETDNLYSIKTLREMDRNFFIRVWTEVMKHSFNSPSSLSVEEQLHSAEIELGPTYTDSCIVAYENTKPLGVIMPHLEPGTKDEGRLFYFGLVPDERGKGKSVLLHQQVLQLLRYQFNASYYIGSTSLKNVPMIQTFVHNGCKRIEKNKVYKRRKG